MWRCVAWAGVPLCRLVWRRQALCVLGNPRMDRETEHVGGGWMTPYYCPCCLLCVVSHPCFSGGKYPAMDTSYQSVKMKNLYFTGGNGCWTPDLCTVFSQKMADFSRNVSKTYWWWYYLTMLPFRIWFTNCITSIFPFHPQVLWRTARTTAARQGASFMASGHLHWRKAWPLEGTTT